MKLKLISKSIKRSNLPEKKTKKNNNKKNTQIYIYIYIYIYIDASALKPCLNPES